MHLEKSFIIVFRILQQTKSYSKSHVISWRCNACVALTWASQKSGKQMREFFIGTMAWIASFFAHPHVDVATVGDDYAVLFRRGKGEIVEPIRITGLKPDHKYTYYGKHFRTLERPQGKLLSTFVTVNDTHIGEIICGYDSHHPDRGPILKNEAGKIPYAEMMSRNAVKEISELNPDAVIIKGDLTDAGLPEDLKAFTKIWEVFGNKTHWVLGNHDVHTKRPEGAPLMQQVDLPGVTLAILDTSIDQQATGQIRPEQLSWIEKIAKKADRPVMIFGHHHLWTSDKKRDAKFFGINPDDSEKLIAIMRENKKIVGYFCGHTHSNHVSYDSKLPSVPLVECAALKEFPGAWDEYRVYETGIQQIMHRLESKECLRWEERTSKLELGLYEKHHYGKLADRCFTIKSRI